MVDNKSIVEQVTYFQKIIDDLENIEVKVDGEEILENLVKFIN